MYVYDISEVRVIKRKAWMLGWGISLCFLREIRQMSVVWTEPYVKNTMLYYQKCSLEWQNPY